VVANTRHALFVNCRNIMAAIAQNPRAMQSKIFVELDFQCFASGFRSMNLSREISAA
jgi:hypothetical protein